MPSLAPSSPNAQDVLIAFKEEFAYEYLRPWKEWYQHPKPGNMLTAAQMVVISSALFNEALGDDWPLQARCILHPQQTPLCVRPEIAEILPKPKLGVAFLYTPGHWMMFVSSLLRKESYALDGAGNIHLKPLAKAAQKELYAQGCPAYNTVLLDLWIQLGGWECGWHALHALRAMLQGLLVEDSDLALQYTPPDSPGAWRSFAIEIRIAVTSIGVSPALFLCPADFFKPVVAPAEAEFNSYRCLLLSIVHHVASGL